MGIYEDTLSNLQSQLNTQQDQTSLYEDKLTNLYGNDKLDKLNVAKANKELQLRKDTQDYGDDNWLVQTAKEMANEFLPYEYQLTVNKDGKRYNTQNKTFNNDDLSNLWNRYQDDPEGDKVLYYLRKLDPVTGQYMYKPGIAHTSAADRYLGQAEAQGYEVIGEKRFHEASAVEKQIHGNAEFLKHRVYDYGTTEEGGATDYWGSGKSELYSKDILGLDTGTSEDYARNYQESLQKMAGLITNDRQREDTFEFIDAFQAGSVRLSGEAIKLLGEAVSTSEGDGVIEAFGKKLKADANKIAGYNPVSSREAMKGLEDSFNRGDVSGYLANMIKGGPQWLAESLPNMAAFAGTAAVTTAATKNPMVGLSAGSALMGAVRANDILDTREELMGRKATDNEIASIYATSTALSLLEYGALKYAFTGKGLIGTDAAGKSINLSKQLMNTPRKRIDMALTLGSNISKGSIAEGGEEVIAGLTEFLMENYGTEKYKGVSIADMLTSDQARTTAIQSFGAGAGAGGLAGTIGPETINTLRIAKQKSEVIEAVPEAAAEKMSPAQKEYAESLKTEGREIDEDGNVVFTDEELDVFSSLKEVEPEAPAQETVAPEAEDMFTKAESTKAKIQELEAQRDAITSKDPEARAEIEVEIGKLDEQLSAQKAEIEEYILSSSIEANTKAMKEEGATDEEVAASNEELKQNIIQMRGATTNILTKADREAGLTIEVSKPAEVRLAEKGGKKAQTFDSYNVKDETIREIVSGGFTKATAQKLLGKVKASKISERLVKHFRAGSDTVKELESIQSSINKALSTEEGRKALGNLVDSNTEMTEEKAMRMVALALAQVKSNITSEYHVNKNAGLKPKAEHARVDDVVQQLGKEYLNSYGLKYAGKAGPLAKKNAEIGRQILEFAQTAGLVKIGTATVSAREVVYPSGKNKGKPIAKSDLGTYMKVVGKETNVNGQSVTMIATDVVELVDNTGKKGVVNSMKANAATILSKLLKPTNQEVPTTEPVEEVPYNEQGEPLSKQEEEIIRTMNAMKFSIKPEALALLKELKEVIYGPNDAIDFDTGSKNPKVKELLALLGTKADVNKDKDSGRSLNKTDALRNILDNLEVLDPKNMYYNYESAINRRIHVMQTILDFQGDKYMARNLITGGEYTTANEAEAKLLKEAVAEELFGSASKENVDALITRGNTILDAAVDTINAKGTLTLPQLLRLSKRLGINNPFKLLSLVRAVADIRNGKEDKITSSYMVEVDASASGVTNTLLNRSGEPSVQAILQKMTIMGGSMDPYAIVNEAVQEIGDYDAIVKPVLEQFSKIYGDSKEAYDKALRTIAKYPVMTWFYGSATTNVATLMSEDIALEVIEKAIDGNKEAVSIVNEIAGTKYSTATITEITDQDILALKKHYRDNVGSIYADHMDTIFPGVVAYKTDMGLIFDILKDTKQWKGLMPTAMAAMEGTPTKNKMSIRKRKQTVEILGDNNAQQMLSEMFDNRASMAVNPQHSTDSALLLLAMKKVLKKNGVDMGIMTVHDATYGNPKMLLEIKAEYDKLTLEMAVNYDYVGAGILEAREAISKVENEAEKRSLTARLDEIEARNKPLQEAKSEFLKDKKVSVLEGAKPVEPKVATQEEEVEEKPTPSTAEVKPEPKLKKKSITKPLLEAISQIRGSKRYDKLATLIESLEVSEINKKVKDKVLKALGSGKIDVGIYKEKGPAKNQYGALPGQIFIGTDIRDRRFSPDNTSKQLEFTADSLVETLGHEVDHAYNWSYIEKNKNNPEVKYMKRVTEKLIDSKTNISGLNDNARIRIEYIRDTARDQGLDSALAETISILNNEGETAAEILGFLEGSTLKRVLAVIKQMIQDIEAYIFDKTPGQRAEILNDETTGIRAENVLMALKMIEDATMVQTALELKNVESEGKPKGITSSNPKQDKVLLDAYLNPAKYADGIVARTNGYMSNILIVFGGTVLDLASPALRAAHVKAKRKSSAYTEVSNLLYTGFITSEIAQKMRSTIGVARHIDTSVLNEALSIADDINQRTKTILTTELTDLKNRINKAYPKKEDQVRIYKMFARTGISGIQYDKEIMHGLINGTMTVEQALKKATKDMDANTLSRAQDLANYYVTGETKDNKTSPYAAELYDMNDKLVVGLLALSQIDGASKMLKEMPMDLKQTLISQAIAVQTLSDEVNMRQPGYDGLFHTDEPKFDTDYDGHYMKDVYNDKYEYKMVTREQMRSSLYTSENDWIIVKEVNKDNIGIVAKKRIGESRTPGIGLNINKFSNGFHMTEEDSIRLSQKLEGMSARDADAYLNRNNIQRDSSGNRYRFILDEKTKVEKLGMKQDAAESLMRTYAHNVELVQMQAVRNLILEKATKRVDKASIEELNKDIEYNYKKGRKEKARVLPMFVTIDYNYKSYDNLPKWVKQEYRTPDSLSTYNGFNKKVQLVRKGEADILLGHKNFSFFGGTDARTAAKWEQGFKELVVMAKQKMVVASASKLAVDTISNMGVLASKDVSLWDMKKYIPEAFTEYMDFSKKRTEIVQLEIRARMGEKGAKNKLDKANEDLKNHKFYQSFKHGFVQSYSTSLVTQDFDTLSGLQHHIDEIIESLTRDKKGKPNEIYDAIKWWQRLGNDKGIGVDHLLNWASEISKIKGTNISTEMKNMAKRLKDKKDVDSIARYVGDIIGSPASELVTLGGAYMVTIDAASKYTLVQSLLGKINPETKKKYTEDEAYMAANETFIDYRQNMPSEIKALSDYGVLLFPSFWIKAQKVIAGLVMYHPATAVGGYAIADFLDVSSANFIDVNIVNRVIDGRVVNDPTSLIDWDILSPWL